MKKIIFKLIVVTLMVSLLVTPFTYAETIINEAALSTTIETEDLSTDFLEEGEIAPMSLASPVQAYLAVNTNSYGAPNPSTGHLQETVAANTDIWVVEKVYCSYNSRYYYYAGYTYNGASHRGYFCEDNVYRNGSKYLNTEVDAETCPANMKVYTSLPDTVYDGPATTYSVTGSVGQESIKLIRTENDYNFIEYTVTSTGKLKRGYLHYTNITGSWADLTAKNASLDGQMFYIKSSTNNYYWSTVGGSNAANTRLNMQAFTGDTHQIYKFVYDSTNKFFYIQPAVGYADNLNRRIAIRWVSGTEHADRRVFLKDAAVVYRQQFWVVKTGSVSGRYKIVPVSSNGTMTITNRANYLNQYYTSASTSSGADVWILESTYTVNSSQWYEQEKTNWCWVASGQSAASAETSAAASRTQSSAIINILGSDGNLTGTITNIAEAANYFIDGNKDSGKYTILESQIYSEYNIRKHIRDDHSILVDLQPATGVGHVITIVGFDWIDSIEGVSPGYYIYYCYDPAGHDIRYFFDYDSIKKYNTMFTINSTKWQHTVAYSTSYVRDTLSIS